MYIRKLKVLEVLFVITALTLVFNSQPRLAKAQSGYISVPYYSQPNWYYCGPACLEMVFDFYGLDIPQAEIADAARTDGTFPDPFGSYSWELRRAAHFSNLSDSAGEISPHITGYEARGLGYAAFEHTYSTIDQLKSLIDAGYPIVVLQWNDLTHDWGHFRVVVGYDDVAETITVHDPLPEDWTDTGKDTSWGGPDNVYSYSDFNDLWAYSSSWALFTHPWDVSIDVLAASVTQGDTFTVRATITYPCPPPFSDAYSADSCEATIQLPAGLSLAAGEVSSKSLGVHDTIFAGGTETINWQVKADSAGSYSLTVEAEGLVEGTAEGHPAGVFTETYDYTDRIGGTSSVSVTVIPIVEVGWIEGTVTDADTGLPIEGATVSADGYSTTTDASGFYSLEVSPGTYDVTAEMTGYTSQTVEGVVVAADATVTQDFALVPVVEAGWIEGTVTDFDTGDPIVGASVDADGYSGTTDGDGYYLIEGVPVGGYTVSCSAAGYVTKEFDATVVKDATTTVDFSLETAAPDTGSFDGTVTDADTELPLEGVTVSANGYSDVTDASGFYSLEVSPGTYDVEATMTGYVSQVAYNLVVVADTVTTQDFALTPAPVGASIESSNAAGVKTDTFNPSDTVYVYGSQFPDTEHDYDIYVVADTTWTDGDSFPTPIAGTATTVASDVAGDIPVTLVWSSPLTPGKYDIVVDVNDNGIYDAGVDALDDGEIEVKAGFLVIPELLGTIMGLAGCFAALAVFRLTKRKHP